MSRGRTFKWLQGVHSITRTCISALTWSPLKGLRGARLGDCTAPIEEITGRPLKWWQGLQECSIKGLSGPWKWLQGAHLSSHRVPIHVITGRPFDHKNIHLSPYIRPFEMITGRPFKWTKGERLYDCTVPVKVTTWRAHPSDYRAPIKVITRSPFDCRNIISFAYMRPIDLIATRCPFRWL